MYTISSWIKDILPSLVYNKVFTQFLMNQGQFVITTIKESEHTISSLIYRYITLVATVVAITIDSLDSYLLFTCMHGPQSPKSPLGLGGTLWLLRHRMPSLHWQFALIFSLPNISYIAS